jgi:hypothetical protein
VLSAFIFFIIPLNQLSLGEGLYGQYLTGIPPSVPLSQWGLKKQAENKLMLKNICQALILSLLLC